ncbi:DUF4325 domain-containing protein [Salinivibrio sp. IB868]|uniref:STAS-like domain-containing protein n=1 Tax=unclassified Salinivibrio TaxID=2636825 RepID=UPI000986D161|nr:MULTISPECIES: STAS-like domain-containing protein [unclassified Salinivibrio]OOE66541.1 DUF4325 domain-containing protein [Salinivibrio sp. IB868]OOE72583.1 DUF4325 domain-containing protein [Salinivibrio sp. IB870]
MLYLNIADFTRYPGPRYIHIGPNSGEEFRERFLIKSLEKDSKVSINFDGVLGYGSSFLEEIFGGVVRAMPSHPKTEHPNGDEIVKHDFLTLDMIDFLKENLVSHEDPSVIEEVTEYINHELKGMESQK